MDLSDTIAPRSDQQNYDDYLSGPKTVTVAEVTAGTSEQPVEVHLVEFPGRPFKPSKSMRRVLVSAWGKDSSVYAGRRMTLYGDPSVKFGGQTVGGIRISHLSHIDKKLTLALTTTRGKRAPFVVEPLKEQVQAPKPNQEATRRMFAALRDVGAGDKATGLAYISDIVGRPVKQSSELTPDEVTAVTQAATTEHAQQQTATQPDVPAEDTTRYDNDQTLDGWPEAATPGGAA